MDFNSMWNNRNKQPIWKIILMTIAVLVGMILLGYFFGDR